ncbi:MAG: glycosyltransferase family 87 protein [Siphonobacter sp.]
MTLSVKILQSVILLCVIILITCGYIVVYHRPYLKAGDLDLYYTSTIHVINGDIPYKDFKFEYPPLAILPIILPGLIFHNSSFQNYSLVFFLENLLFIFLLGITIYNIAIKLNLSKFIWKILARYAILILLSWITVSWRFDIFCTLLTALSFLSVLRKQAFIGGIWISLAIVTKLYPIVFIPVFLLYFFIQKKYTQLFYLILGCGIVIGLTTIGIALTAGDAILSFLNYHQLRGLQIESIGGGFILVLHILHYIAADVVFNYGAFHLASSWSDNLAKWSPIFFVITYLVIIGFIKYDFTKDYKTKKYISSDSLLKGSVSVLLIFIITNKVFSPQYLIWLIPFILFLSIKYLKIIMVIFILTFLLFPFIYRFLLEINPFAVGVLVLRNLLVIIVLLLILVGDRYELLLKDNSH